jgi:hypothetical protein
MLCSRWPAAAREQSSYAALYKRNNKSRHVTEPCRCRRNIETIRDVEQRWIHIHARSPTVAVQLLLVSSVGVIERLSS